MLVDRVRSIVKLAVAVVAVAGFAAGGGARPSYLVEISNDAGTTVALVRDGRVIRKFEANSLQAVRSPDRSLVAWIDNGWVALRVATVGGKRLDFLPGVQSFAWAPTGHRLAYVTSGGRLQILDPASGRSQAVRLTQRLSKASIWRWVNGEMIIAAQPSADPHWEDLIAVPLAGGRPRQLANIGAFGAACCDSVALSRAGSRLLVGIGYPRKYMAVDVVRGTRTVIAAPARVSSAFWLPGGPRAGFLVRNGARERVVAVGADGRSRSTLAALAPGERVSGEFVTSPDDRRLAFVVTGGGRQRLVTIGAGDRRERTIPTASSGALSARCWFDDGRIALATAGNGRRLLETRDEPDAAVRTIFRALPGVYLVELSCS